MPCKAATPATTGMAQNVLKIKTMAQIIHSANARQTQVANHGHLQGKPYINSQNAIADITGTTAVAPKKTAPIIL